MTTAGTRSSAPVWLVSVVACVLLFLMLSQASAAEANDANRGAGLTSGKCLPVVPLSADQVFASPKKVFAHYFDRFPLSIDNKPWERDYYSMHYLNAEGEKGKWRDHGGFLRSRPLPVPVGEPGDFALENLKREVKMAIDAGIGGFAYDILDMDDTRPQGRFMNMATAAMAVDPRFKLLLMPDMSALKRDPDNVFTIVKALYDVENIYRLNDGSVVIAPFLSESVPQQAWDELLKRLSSAGFRVAFVPTFLSLGDSYIREYAPLSRGMGTFGTPLPRMAGEIASYLEKLRAKGKISMVGISGQGYRPKSYLYWESEGSLAYTQSWLSAIKGQADWVQLTTWNDYSESTQIAPYTDAYGSAGTAFYNLTAYFSRWFLEGKEPSITHDVIYYLYRKEPVSADAPKSKSRTASSHAYLAAKDEIEVLSFLTSPGRLIVEISGKSYAKDSSAGMSRFTVPMSPGVPRFSLERGGKTIISTAGKTQIVGQEGLPSGYSDLTYWGGSASADGECAAPEIHSEASR